MSNIICIYACTFRFTFTKSLGEDMNIRILVFVNWFMNYEFSFTFCLMYPSHAKKILQTYPHYMYLEKE